MFETCRSCCTSCDGSQMAYGSPWPAQASTLSGLPPLYETCLCDSGIKISRGDFSQIQLLANIFQWVSNKPPHLERSPRSPRHRVSNIRRRKAFCKDTIPNHPHPPSKFPMATLNKIKCGRTHGKEDANVTRGARNWFAEEGKSLAKVEDQL